jgi:hypothetical protein
MQNLNFETWFEEVKQNAIDDYGFSRSETEHFQDKNWKQFYEQGCTPFEAVLQHLKKAFKHYNG